MTASFLAMYSKFLLSSEQKISKFRNAAADTSILRAVSVPVACICHQFSLASSPNQSSPKLNMHESISDTLMWPNSQNTFGLISYPDSMSEFTLLFLSQPLVPTTVRTSICMNKPATFLRAECRFAVAICCPGKSFHRSTVLHNSGDLCTCVHAWAN